MAFIFFHSTINPRRSNENKVIFYMDICDLFWLRQTRSVAQQRFRRTSKLPSIITVGQQDTDMQQSQYQGDIGIHGGTLKWI